MTTSPGVRPIEALSAADQVTSELRRSIVAGDLEPGQRFSLREISDRLNVSFIPVREALRSLESEGLVLTSRGKSAVVAPLNVEDLHAIYRIRRRLEPDLAYRAAPLISDEELDRLEAVAITFGDEALGMDAIYEAHRAFHLDLLTPAASTWDIRILKILQRAAERFIRIGVGRLDPDPHEHTRRRTAHVALVDAFRTHDPKAAADATHEHLAKNEELTLRGLSMAK